MTANDIQKLKDAAIAADAIADAAAADAAANPNDTAKLAAAEEAARKADEANAALAKAEAEGASGAGAAGAGHAGGGGASGSAGREIELPHAPWWHYVVIGSAMGLLLLGVSLTARIVFKNRAERMTSAYKLAPSNSNTVSGAIPEGGAAPDYRKPTACPAATPAEKGNFVLLQRAKIVEFGDSHRDAAIEFGSYFFANILILAVFGFISLITLLLITKRGIANAHGTLVAVFLLSSGIGLIYQGMFGVFQQKGNVDENHRQSVEYGRLVDEIDSYCATGKLAVSDPNVVLAKLVTEEAPSEEAGANKERPAPDENLKKVPTFFVSVEPDDFILYIEWRTEALKKFSISLDEKPVQSLTDPSRLTGL